MCKISLWSVEYILNQSTTNFDRISNSFEIQCKPDISRSCISRNWIYRGRMLDPIFWRPWARYFSRNRGNSLDPIRWKHFFAKSAHRDIAFVPVRGRQFFATSTPARTLAYLSMRAGTHAVWWPGTLGGPLTPPLCCRVGSIVNVNRDYKSLIWA